MPWNLRKKKLQILIGANPIDFGCFYKTIGHGTGFCSIVGFHENEVLSADGTVMGDLSVFEFYPFEISVNLLLKFSLTLLFPVSVRQVIEFIIGVKNVGNHVVGFPGYGSFGSRKPDIKSAKGHLASCTERIHGIPDYETDTGNIPGRRKVKGSFFRRTTYVALGCDKTSGGCLVCVLKAA